MPSCDCGAHAFSLSCPPWDPFLEPAGPLNSSPAVESLETVAPGDTLVFEDEHEILDARDELEEEEDTPLLLS